MNLFFYVIQFEFCRYTMFIMRFFFCPTDKDEKLTHLPPYQRKRHFEVSSFTIRKHPYFNAFDDKLHFYESRPNVQFATLFQQATLTDLNTKKKQFVAQKEGLARMKETYEKVQFSSQSQKKYVRNFFSRVYAT